MKKKAPFKLIAFFTLLLIVIFYACAPKPPCPPCGVCPACDSTRSFLMRTYNIETMSFQKTKSSHDWIILDITFKQNTDEEFRVNAVRAIEKMWIKDAAPIAKNPANVSVSAAEFPLSDTLKVQLRLSK